MKLYLAGPMRGIKDFNFPAFHAATAKLREQGHEVFNAAEYEEEMFGVGFAKSETGDFKDIAHIEWDFREAFFKDCEYITKVADAVAVLPGWQNSKGAKAEVAVAQTIGLPVLHADSLKPIADEERVVDAKTGGMKAQKLERFDLIPAGPLTMLARVYGMGAKKYEDNNWRKGYRWSLTFGACMRHLWAFWNGEEIDPESGLPHVAHAMWHCATMLEFMESYRDGDDRYVAQAGMPEVRAPLGYEGEGG